MISTRKAEANFHFYLCDQCGTYTSQVERIEPENSWKIETWAWRSGKEAGYQFKKGGGETTIYRNNLKNRFLPASALPQKFRFSLVPCPRAMVTRSESKF